MKIDYLIKFKNKSVYLVLSMVGWSGERGKWKVPLRVGGAELARDGEGLLRLAEYK